MAESKYNFLKYYNKRTDTSSANYKKLGDGETLYHRITLEDFIKTAFIDGPPKSKNPYNEKGMFSLLQRYAAMRANGTIYDPELKIEIPNIPDPKDKKALEIYNRLTEKSFQALLETEAHVFFNEGMINDFEDFILTENVIATQLSEPARKVASTNFSQLLTGINEFNNKSGTLKLSTEVADNLSKDLKTKRLSRVVPFLKTDLATGVQVVGEELEEYIQNINNYISENQMKAMTSEGPIKNKHLTEVSLAKAARAKLALMLVTGFRTAEASSVLRFNPKASTSIDGDPVRYADKAFENTHFSTFNAVPTGDGNYVYKVFVPNSVTKTAGHLYVNIPPFAAKILIQQLKDTEQFGTRSLFAYKDYSTGKIIDSYNYETRSTTGRIDKLLFGKQSPFMFSNIGFNVDTQKPSGHFSAHDVRRFFSTAVRTYIDGLKGTGVSQDQLEDLHMAADMFQGRRSMLPSAEAAYGSKEMPYAGGGLTALLSNKIQDDIILPKSESLLEFNNKLKLTFVDQSNFKQKKQIKLTNKDRIDGAAKDKTVNVEEAEQKLLQDSNAKTVKNITKKKKTTKPKTIDDLKKLAGNIQDYPTKKAFRKMLTPGANISFDEALFEYNKIIEEQSGKDVPTKTNALKKTIKTGAVAAVGVLGTTGIAKALPFVGPAAGAASATEISMRPEEEFDIEDAILSPDARKQLKAGIAFAEGVSPVPLDLSLLNLLPGEQNFRTLNEIVVPTASELTKQKELAEKSATQLENYQDDRTTIKDSTDIQMNNLFN